MHKICKIHGSVYNYVCSECLRPFLRETQFSSLKEVRNYQIHYARKVKFEDKGNSIKCIGIIKLKVLKEIAYIGAYFYDLNKQKLKNSLFKVYKPRFSEYFPSVLFLNQSVRKCCFLIDSVIYQFLLFYREINFLFLLMRE